MANTDLSTQFEKISDRAKTATNNLRAASQRSRNQLAVDAASAHDKATAAANQLKDNADGARNKVSSQWQEIRDKWQAHVAKVQTRVDEKADQLDARVAAADADLAESYALDAIDFAQAAVDEAIPQRSMRCTRARTRRRSKLIMPAVCELVTGCVGRIASGRTRFRFCRRDLRVGARTGSVRLSGNSTPASENSRSAVQLAARFRSGETKIDGAR